MQVRVELAGEKIEEASSVWCYRSVVGFFFFFWDLRSTEYWESGGGVVGGGMGGIPFIFIFDNGERQFRRCIAGS